MTPIIRVGIIGCGRIARESHLPRFLALPGVKVAALYNRHRGKAEACRRDLAPDAATFSDLDRFFATGLDAVSICTPTALHYEQTMAALAQGCHVLCEKPMALDTTRAGRMVTAARKAGRILQINQSLRYHPVYIGVAALIAKGRVGQPLHIRCIRATAGNPSTPGGWAPGSTWFLSKKYGGGVLLDIGVHMADLLQWYGGRVVEVAGDVGVRTPGVTAPERAVAVFRFAGGATGVLELHWNMRSNANLLEIYGTEGALRLGYNPPWIEWTPPAGRPGKTRRIAPKPRERVPDSFACFLRAVRGRAPSPTPGELGYDALALCEAVERASRSGRFVKVKHCGRSGADGGRKRRMDG